MTLRRRDKRGNEREKENKKKGYRKMKRRRLVSEE
jgi:hypothetical protein